jgi:hypothetical protein
MARLEWAGWCDRTYWTYRTYVTYPSHSRLMPATQW